MFWNPSVLGAVCASVHLPRHVIFTNNSGKIDIIITGLVDYEMSLKNNEEHFQS